MLKPCLTHETGVFSPSFFWRNLALAHTFTMTEFSEQVDQPSFDTEKYADPATSAEFVQEFCEKAQKDSLPDHAPDGVRRVGVSRSSSSYGRTAIRMPVRLKKAQKSCRFETVVASMKSSPNTMIGPLRNGRKSFHSDKILRLPIMIMILRVRLNAPSPNHLCKTILFENTKWKATGDFLGRHQCACFAKLLSCLLLRSFLFVV